MRKKIIHSLQELYVERTFMYFGVWDKKKDTLSRKMGKLIPPLQNVLFMRMFIYLERTASAAPYTAMQQSNRCAVTFPRPRTWIDSAPICSFSTLNPRSTAPRLR